LNNLEESEISWKVNIKTIIERGYDLDIKNPTKEEEAHEYSSTELMQLMEKSFAKSNSILNQLKEVLK
jgi:type I restriction enzyme M protein